MRMLFVNSIVQKSVFYLFLVLLCACSNGETSESSDFVEDLGDMNEHISDKINAILLHANDEGKVDDTTKLILSNLVNDYYKNNSYTANWSNNSAFLTIADSLLLFIEEARLYGLFPNDYHFQALSSITKRISADTAAVGDSRDATLWSKADILFTDAFFTICKHLNFGRLKPDSMYMRLDSVLQNDFYFNQIDLLKNGKSMSEIFHSLEPSHQGYVDLKHAIKSFLDSANFSNHFTYISYPYYDSLLFVQSLTTRLQEEGLISRKIETADSLQLREALIKFQKNKKLVVNGKFGLQVVRQLNNTNPEKFRRIAINLDRYKALPEKMPKHYIWVNIPAYQLYFWHDDSLRIESRVVVGKPHTRTPLLTSAISDLVLYPQWTIPNSIVMNEIVPSLRRNPGYLAKKGYSLMTWAGVEINPYEVNWGKYKKGIPYRIMQGSGDDNALGVMKFNFPNKYSVYLHDTNQRYLFKNDKRALSHGCVRVQEWEKLTYYISTIDSISFSSDTSRVVADSIRVWLDRKEKHVVKVKSKLPVYFRYFTAVGNKGKLIFYDDIYNEDKAAIEAYFLKNK